MPSSVNARTLITSTPAMSVTATVVTPPSHGTLSGFNSATGEVTYTPATGYVGEDSFEFTLTDDGGRR